MVEQRNLGELSSSRGRAASHAAEIPLLTAEAYTSSPEPFSPAIARRPRNPMGTEVTTIWALRDEERPIQL